MEGGKNVRILKEVKSAKRAVETAIRIFGPPNITSILDRDTFGEKLGAISTKLEIYIEMAEDMIAELEELKDCESETECNRKINNLTKAIVKKVNENEFEVKKKIEKIMKEIEDNKNEKLCSDPSESITTTSTELPRDESSIPNT
jgi:gas vesicle protein